MSANTMQQTQDLVSTYKKQGKSSQEALTEFQDAMEDEEALAGIVSGLEDMEAGRVTRVTPKFLEESRAAMIKKLGL
tara:strand:+ start:3157 stop:3387 length:231 start_codon:yes stop_codon:yes gene_type:complete